jgi:hypothetical protein
VSARGRAGAVVLLLVLAACTSPEATRQRAGGPGGDTGNRGSVVEMHEGSQPYWNTPRRLAEDVRAPAVAARPDERPRAGEAPAAASPR